MGGKAPTPDPKIGIAAQMQADLGLEMLDFMKEQSEITNGWATEDRARYVEKFQPMEDKLVQRIDERQSDGYGATRVAEAKADVTMAFDQQKQQMQRSNAAMGVRPDSGRAIEQARTVGNVEALSQAGAANTTRRTVQAEQDQALATGVNMGQGYAVNPGTSMGISNNATQAGYSGAQGGLGAQIGTLQNQYSQQLQAHQAGQSNLISGVAGLGQLAGMAFMSSEKLKENKSPAEGNLDVIRQLPVENWKYKDGVQDSAQHVGPYAEDFHRLTGLGNDQEIQAIDMAGVTAGAVKEIAVKLDEVTRTLEGMGAQKAA